MSRATAANLGVILVVIGCVQVSSATLAMFVPAPVAAPRLAGQTPPTAPPPASVPVRAMLDRYCVTCHNQRQRAAGLTLDTADVRNITGHAEVWEKVARKLRTRTMPPPGLPRPEAPAYDAAAAWLETELDRAAADAPNPGTAPIHRLNRAEYANAIRDLLGIEIDSRSLLVSDDSDHGFDNVAGVLSISPVAMQRYVSAARRISRLAVGDPSIGPAFTAKTYQLPKTLYQDERMSEDLPFGSRGGLAVEHYFPLDGEYLFKIRLRRTHYGYVRGLFEPHQLEVRLDGERIKAFTVGGEEKGRPAPVSYSGNVAGDPEFEEYMLTGADAHLEVRFLAKAGTRVVGVSFVNQFREPEGVLQPPIRGFAWEINEMNSSPSGPWVPGIESVAVSGPFQTVGVGDTTSRQKIFLCRPRGRNDEDPCARSILSTLARRAFRRSVATKDVDSLLTFFHAGQAEAGFDAGIRRAIERLLVDPEFLFRIERDPANVPPARAYRVSDVDLASRLSFFLWSSIPDDELLDLAARGRLRDPVVLEAQVRRLLRDPRSSALVENFAGQWLSLRKVAGSAPDRELFPEFDENLRAAFRRETELFVDSQLREDRSVLDLFRAKYTFLNDRLASHYGVPDVYGSHFRRVALGGAERAGLLGHGSILMVTSYGNRTSPVLRGLWVLENILGTPPPPPPPDVPDLQDKDEGGKVLTLRQRMERHRRNPACATCHVRMDPLGFALENFDATGRWRTIGEGGNPIDNSGAFPDGSTFNGLSGLQKVLVEHRDQVVGTVTEKLLTYALGRIVEPYDLPAVRRITREAGARDDRWSAIILGIVQSTPFQMRRSAS